MKNLIKRHLAAVARYVTANSGQCSVCTGWFDNWPGGVCDACQFTGRR